MVQEESSEQKSATGGCENREDTDNNLVQEAGVGDVARVMMKEAERRCQGRNLRTLLVREGN